MLHYVALFVLLVTVAAQSHGGNADVTLQENSGEFQSLQQLPCNKNHNHVERDLSDVLNQIRPEVDERAGNAPKSNTRRFVNQLSPDTHVLNQDEYQKCKKALQLLEKSDPVRDSHAGGEDDSLNEENAYDAPFYYQALRRSFGQPPDPKPTENELNRDNVQSVADPPSPSGSPLVNYDFQRRMMLLKNKRVCYACSSASNPTCEVPDRSTTIKYCSADQDACVVKSYSTPSKTKVIVRDCATSCKEQDPLNISPKYKKCSICKEDLCNGANLAYGGKTAVLIGIIFAVAAFFKSM